MPSCCAAGIRASNCRNCARTPGSTSGVLSQPASPTHPRRRSCTRCERWWTRSGFADSTWSARPTASASSTRSSRSRRPSATGSPRADKQQTRETTHMQGDDNTAATGPLSHVRVLDFTQLLQGPLATQILGDLGADVIKVEKPGGEWMRSWGILASTTDGEMDSFLGFNRNKRSIAVDLKDPAIVRRLLERGADVDVVGGSFRPGVMDRLGLGYDDFARVNPGIRYARSGGYVPSGPYRDRPGQDRLVQALSGALHLTGRRDDPPTPCGIGISDEYTGLHLVVAVLAALSHRQATGEGQRVEVDLFSCTVAAQQQELTVWLNHGK